MTSPIAASAESPASKADVHRAALEAIAVEIEALGATYPALASFDAKRDFSAEHLRILYEHRVEGVVVQRGVKRELVRQPQPGGLYLHLDFHEHVEAHEGGLGVFRGHYRNQGRRVLYIVRAGEGAGDLEARLWEIAARHGTLNVGLGGSETKRAVSR